MNDNKRSEYVQPDRLRFGMLKPPRWSMIRALRLSLSQTEPFACR